MMPLAAILSTSDWAVPAAVAAAALSVPSTVLRRPFRPVRSFERRRRFASRRLTFCRFALRADLFRLAKLSSLVENGETRDCTTPDGDAAPDLRPSVFGQDHLFPRPARQPGLRAVLAGSLADHGLRQVFDRDRRPGGAHPARTGLP